MNFSEKKGDFQIKVVKKNNMNKSQDTGWLEQCDCKQISFFDLSKYLEHKTPLNLGIMFEF